MEFRSCALRTRDKGGRGHKLEIRNDFVSNALTSVSKDTLVLEIITEEGDILTETNANQSKRNSETKPFTYVSLFSGIGGFEQALNKLGGTCVLASEIDRFANQAYEALYGEPTVGDITKVAAEDVPDHDVLVGGFPCQAFSVAGKRGGFDDARGTLFFEAARIAAEKQPKLVLLENVKGLVGHDKGRTLDTIVKTLNEIGYTVDFNVLNSKYFGVPQNRERIFIVGVRDDLAKPSDWIIEGNNVVAKGKRRISGYDDVKTFNFDWPAQEEVTVRLRDILESDVDEKYYLSKEKTADLVAQLDDKVRTEKFIMDGKNSFGGNHKVFDEGIAPTCLSNDFKEPKKVVEPIVEQFTEGDGVSCCVDANYAKGTSPGDVGKGRRTHVIERQPRYRIRKLTPLECFRLQGFSDEEHQTLVDADISNSQRYKQAGNAVTVNVIEAIGERLLTVLDEA
ncbi:DNA (cytosine-5-)-methyltransferase [Terribacillus sp. 179-K 1B1 HS]|uniref:DNA (cytosine-5-)-methyltransferase n=1 Tax=Terribacillus sp. 179-K 1B1 HS TaxID=3142388 RepID=UPI00399F6D5C